MESDFKVLINEIVSSYLPEDLDSWVKRFPTKEKIIHDSVWGTFLLFGHEIAILDTPLLQRLRFIKQTGGTYLTYPSARHTRFEHTLGVLCQAQRMIDVLKKKDAELLAGAENNIRFAALMHDSGHGPFSHTSEMYAGLLEDTNQFKISSDKFRNSGVGEIFSALIVLSESFKNFIDHINEYFKVSLDTEKAVSYITGDVELRDMYLSEFIHGPFDADKLDYMHRDGQFSGLKLNVDVDRLINSMRILSYRETGNTMMTRRLAGSIAGATPLEQIMFNKIVLHSGIYQHHKVRACECMVWAMFELAIKTGCTVGGYRINSGTDFLKLNDDRILVEELTDNEDIKKIIRSILVRDLWKRAIVISRKTIEPKCWSKDTEDTAWNEFLKLQKPDRHEERRRYAELIWKAAGEPCSLHEVWLDVPKMPSLEEAKRTWIHISDDDRPIELDQLVPVDDWLNQYGIYKWRAHVYAPRMCVKKINEATKVVLKREIGLEFVELSSKLAKVS